MVFSIVTVMNNHHHSDFRPFLSPQKRGHTNTVTMTLSKNSLYVFCLKFYWWPLEFTSRNYSKKFNLKNYLAGRGEKSKTDQPIVQNANIEVPSNCSRIEMLCSR